MVSMRKFSNQMVDNLGLSAPPVAVKFLDGREDAPPGAKRLERHRYCQALMRARDGESVLLDEKGISCPAAAAAFGFRRLPENLRNGRGLVGFGIVQEAAVGQHMFEEMPTLPRGSIAALHLMPLDKAESLPDVVVIEDEVEKLMWLSLAALNTGGGSRIRSSTAVLQAACVDVTIIPFLEQRLNQCFGCYGCRDATDVGRGEALVGFPGSSLPDLVKAIGHLGEKAIPSSRAKKAFAALHK